MIATKYVYLAPSFEDEGIDDGHNWIEYPGRIVAGVLSEILQGLGCKVDPIYSEGEKGWEFNFAYQRVPMWSRVGAIEDFLIVLSASGWLDLSGRKKKTFAQFLERLDETLQRDPRFSNIRWYTQQQMDAGEWDYPGKDEPEADPT
ncbi:MAG: hypothetical protein E7812_04320 [Phenylobacterium sp.]|nr:MAG: hypothetical protein E7812_04320 [Phenylobacterium sp.]